MAGLSYRDITYVLRVVPCSHEAVRLNAKLLVEKERTSLIIIDGPPGIGCPVIASVTGADAGLIVAEPTLSGIHDLKRAVQLLRHFNVKPFVCVNMYDVNVDNTDKISRFCQENGIEVVGRIPFNPIVTEAMVNGKTVIEYSPKCDVTEEIACMWNKLGEELALR